MWPPPLGPPGGLRAFKYLLCLHLLAVKAELPNIWARLSSQAPRAEEKPKQPLHLNFGWQLTEMGAPQPSSLSTLARFGDFPPDLKH